MFVWSYSLVSVFVVSLISLVGILTFSLKVEKLKKALTYLVGFSSGALFGDTFIHLIPEAMEQGGSELQMPFFAILGIIISFSVERFLQWRHCHIPTSGDHPHTFAYMNLFGDAIHNFIDGIIIGASYLAGIQIGIATTLAVVFHEIPQEIGDFGVLIYGGFHKSRALLFNFLTALTAVVGTIVALSLGIFAESFIPPLIPFAAGNFIYIAGSDLLPELRKDEPALVKSILQLVSFVVGVAILASLVFLE